MAYSNWGAFILNNDGVDLTKTNADESYVWNGTEWEHRYLTDEECELPIEKRPFSIGGHAVLFDNDIVVVWYKRYFPSIYINSEGKWMQLTQREMIVNECNSSTDDNFYLKYPRAKARLHFNKDSQEFEINNDEVYLDAEDIISDFTVNGVRFDKLNYDYFDVWNITWTDGLIYHVIIGQSIGRGYENSNISKFIRKYGEIFDTRFIFTPYEKSKYLLRKAVVKYRRHGEYYWLRRDIKSFLKELLTFKWSNLYWRLDNIKDRFNKIRYMIAD